VTNMDIIRSFGGIDLLNYIGDPEARYSSSYAPLDKLNHYYSQRYTHSNNIQEYIRFIRNFDKSLFYYIKELVPARARVATGLLIEPHLLERNRVAWKKPSKEEPTYDALTDVSDTTDVVMVHATEDALFDMDEWWEILGEKPTYQATFDVEETEEINVYPVFHDAVIGTDDTEALTVLPLFYDADFTTLYYSQSIINTADDFQMKEVGGQLYWELSYDETWGQPQSRFGLFAVSGSTDMIFVKDGIHTKRRVKVELIPVEEYKNQYQLISGSDVEYELLTVTESFERLNILHITASHTAGATLADGYLPDHRRYTSDLTRGLMNSFYYGCTQDATTTTDGADPVEVFVSNPNVLKVNKAGRDAAEPILEVD
jgi:hypothetical protein